jgi:hypothetical protein
MWRHATVYDRHSPDRPIDNPMQPYHESRANHRVHNRMTKDRNKRMRSALYYNHIMSSTKSAPHITYEIDEFVLFRIM